MHPTLGHGDGLSWCPDTPAVRNMAGWPEVSYIRLGLSVYPSPLHFSRSVQPTIARDHVRCKSTGPTQPEPYLESGRKWPTPG